MNLGRPAEAEQEQVLALDVRQHQSARDPVEQSADGAPPRPCSSHVYHVALMLARAATSSRRSPGVRRRCALSPSAAGSILLRLSFKYAPSAFSSRSITELSYHSWYW